MAQIYIVTGNHYRFISSPDLLRRVPGCVSVAEQESCESMRRESLRRAPPPGAGSRPCARPARAREPRAARTRAGTGVRGPRERDPTSLERERGRTEIANTNAGETTTGSYAK
jgi:hypothetical protein